MTVSLPIRFCASIPVCQNITLYMPFTGPRTIGHPCCKGIGLSLEFLSDLLAPLVPLLQFLECVTKLVTIVTDIPKAIGPPPSPSKIAGIAAKIVDLVNTCLPFFISLTPIGAALNICKTIASFINFIVEILKCARTGFAISLTMAADALTLRSSPDNFLAEMGICLELQVDDTVNSLFQQLQELLLIINILNSLLSLVFSFIPGLEDELRKQGLFPLMENVSFGGGAGLLSPALLDAIEGVISVGTLLIAIFSICGTGTATPA